MTPVTHANGRRIALFGLGGSGLATALALIAGGARVAAWDDSSSARETAGAAGVPLVDLAAADWSGFASLVLAPGVPLTHPAPHWSVVRAGAAGIEVIGDVELFCRERARLAPDAPLIAITGTNGKSTTTALIAHLLTTAGRDVAMGGNIGTAVLALPPPAVERVHVLEVSSFQIDLTPSLAPSVGVLLNVTPDHLDRHGTMEAYAAIKERLVRASGHAVIATDDDWTRAIADRRAASGHGLETVTAANAPDLAQADALRGAHNAQNAAAAAAVARHLGVSGPTIAAALASYPGLPHRMEVVGRVAGVTFVNDSKATNADSTRGALAGGRDIRWIAGGKPKDGGIDSLAPFFDNVAKAYLIGAASEAFAATLAGRAAFARCGTLDAAVTAAATEAPPGSMVLLSPACASYDQFRNFEERGDRFRALVAALPGFEPPAKGTP